MQRNVNFMNHGESNYHLQSNSIPCSSEYFNPVFTYSTMQAPRQKRGNHDLSAYVDSPMCNPYSSYPGYYPCIPPPSTSFYHSNAFSHSSDCKRIKPNFNKPSQQNQAKTTINKKLNKF